MATEKNVLKGQDSAVTLPPDLSLGQFMLEHLSSFGDRIALIDSETDERRTFQDILDSSRRIALYLSAQGLTVNDRISICSENCLNFSIPLCASMFLGATSCPLNPSYSPKEFVHALNISKPVMIFASATALRTLQPIVRDLSWSPALVSMSETSVDGVPRLSDLLSTVETANANAFTVAKVNAREHVLAVMCSSGTTGLPKGVMLTDRNFLTATSQLLDVAAESAARSTVTLNILPFFHAYAFVTFVNQLALGVTSVIMPRFESDKFLSAIQKYKIQHLVLVPPLMVFLAKSSLVDRYDLSSVKQIWCGAAPLSRKIQDDVYQRLNKPKIKQGYGLTETTLGVLKTPAHANKPGSVGTLAPDTFAKVMPVGENAPKEPLGPYKEGELCFKGDLIMKGYCGDESSTSATMDKDGWLHTGDIGYYDEEGFFYIVDRLKELIKYKGFQVPPAELEGILLTHPEVVDAAVVGVPDEICGELPLGFVVKQPGSKITEDALVQFVNSQVSSQKWLRAGVRFINVIPKTASGKILRRMLRDKLKSKL